MEEQAEAEPRRRVRRRGALVAASAVTVLLGLGAAWTFRAPMASALIHGWLGGAGIDSSFEIARIDLGGVTLSALELGPTAAPDFTAESAEVRIAWAPLPRLAAMRLTNPHLRARISEQGASLGQLDALLRGGGGAQPVRLPDMEITITGGRIDLDTPFGALAATAEASGRLGENFRARADLQPLAEGARIEGAEGSLVAQSNAQGANATLTLAAANGEGEGGLSFDGFSATASFTAQNDFLASEARARVSLANASAAGWSGSNVVADVELGNAADPTLRRWSGAAYLVARDVHDGDTPNVRAGAAQINANIAIDTGARESVRTAVRARAEHVALTADGRAALTRAWPELGALPIGPLVASARDATLRALMDTTLDAPFRVALSDAGVVIAATLPVTAQSASGARLTVTPRESALTREADGGIDGGAQIAIGGGGFPDATIEIARIRSRQGAPLTAEGAIHIADWRANGAALTARDLPFRFAQTESGGQIIVSGPALMSGPLGGGAASVRDLQAPLNLSLDWGANLRVAPVGDACMVARFAELTLPGLVFRDGAAPLCADNAGYFASGPEAGVSGGVNIAALALDGHMQGDRTQRARLEIAHIGARFSGTGERLVLDALVEAPRLHIALAPDHPLTVTGARITAQMLAGAGTWRAAGRIEDGTVDDPTLPANITDFASDWRAEPRGDEAIIRFEQGGARVTDRPPAGAPENRVAAFQDMRAANISATLADGRLVAEGALLLEAGAKPIGAFDATHVLEPGTGEATLHIRDLQFTPAFQPEEISKLAIPVVANVSGPVNAEINAHWTPTTVTADGRFRTEGLSFSSATLPIVQGVTGEIVFDDLLTFTTPPRQRVTVDLINPGVEVRDGVIEFQLLREGRVAVQRAEWPFASGVLAVAPTEIALGAEETRFSLTLTDVDVGALLAQLNVPDLVATGRVAGQFPLVLTEQSARIENGTLSADGGGEIYYAGAAVRESTGIARLAFQALTSFRYDNLSLELNGDLDGELVTAINFSGRNAGDLDVAAGGTGPLRATVAGVPFIFNVRVVAPFRRLGEMAAGAFDPRVAIQQAGQAAPDDVLPVPPVDQPPPATE